MFLVDFAPGMQGKCGSCSLIVPKLAELLPLASWFAPSLLLPAIEPEAALAILVIEVKVPEEPSIGLENTFAEFAA